MVLGSESIQLIFCLYFFLVLVRTLWLEKELNLKRWEALKGKRKNNRKLLGLGIRKINYQKLGKLDKF